MDESTDFLQKLREKRLALAAERQQQKLEQELMEKELVEELDRKQKVRQESRSKLLDSISSMTALYQMSTSKLDLSAPSTLSGVSSYNLTSKVIHESSSGQEVSKPLVLPVLPVLPVQYPG